MIRTWRSLRVQLAVLGFLAIYLPVLVLFGVAEVTEREAVTNRDGVVVTSDSTERSEWTLWTAIGLGPAAAALAWWLAGRAVRPIEHVRRVAEEIEATDLNRRIALTRGPIEIRSLADSFDAMLSRLEAASDVQRRLVEDTSHELRTPLAVLATNADVLLAHPAPTLELYREGLERSRSAAKRLRTAIDALLVDARGRARILDRRPADLMALAASVAEEARVLAATKGVRIVVTGPASVTCSVDEPTVTRAVSGLLDNAVRHAPPDTRVDIAVTETESEVSVTVSDQGPGVPAAEQDRVFERYWHDRGDSQGSGLGLPIARQVAVAHGGSLTLTSPPPAGHGSAFRLALRR